MCIYFLRLVLVPVHKIFQHSLKLDFVPFWPRLPRLFALGRLARGPNLSDLFPRKGFLTPSFENKRLRERIFRGPQGQKGTKSSKNILLFFFFIYFLVTSADLIGVEIGSLQLKLPQLVGLLLFCIFFSCRKVVVEKKLFFCFLLIFSSMLISSFKSLAFSRSLVYSVIYVFSFCAYFLVPFNLMYFGNEIRLLQYYVWSFFFIGAYAFLQFFFSVFGVELPFTTQKLIFARGSAFALEPSFYALYAIPFVAYLNAKFLLSPSMKRWPVLVANLFLLISTTTTAFVSYFVFFLVLFFFPLVGLILCSLFLF